MICLLVEGNECCKTGLWGKWEYDHLWMIYYFTFNLHASIKIVFFSVLDTRLVTLFERFVHFHYLIDKYNPRWKQITIIWRELLIGSFFQEKKSVCFYIAVKPYLKRFSKWYVWYISLKCLTAYFVSIIIYDSGKAFMHH